MKVLYELNRGRFCRLFRELGPCLEGDEEPQDDVRKRRGMAQFDAIWPLIDVKETWVWEPRLAAAAGSQASYLEDEPGQGSGLGGEEGLGGRDGRKAEWTGCMYGSQTVWERGGQGISPPRRAVAGIL